MGEPTLEYSPIQLKMTKQHRVIPIGRLKGIPVDLDSVRTMEEFEVIDIVDNSIPYPTLLGLDWAFENQVIINFKTRKMIFGSREYRVIAPLDPSEAGRYVEPVTKNFITEEINQLYRTTHWKESQGIGIQNWNCAEELQIGEICSRFF
jgi:hypothetical protein